MMTGDEALMLQGWGLNDVQKTNAVTKTEWKDFTSRKHTWPHGLSILKPPYLSLEPCVPTTPQETFLLHAAGNAMCGFVLCDVFMGILTYTPWPQLFAANAALGLPDGDESAVHVPLENVVAGDEVLESQLEEQMVVDEQIADKKDPISKLAVWKSAPLS